MWSSPVTIPLFLSVIYSASLVGSHCMTGWRSMRIESMPYSNIFVWAHSQYCCRVSLSIFLSAKPRWAKLVCPSGELGTNGELGTIRRTWNKRAEGHSWKRQDHIHCKSIRHLSLWLFLAEAGICFIQIRNPSKISIPGRAGCPSTKELVKSTKFLLYFLAPPTISKTCLCLFGHKNWFCQPLNLSWKLAACASGLWMSEHVSTGISFRVSSGWSKQPWRLTEGSWLISWATSRNQGLKILGLNDLRAFNGALIQIRL